jgi:xanthine dehydrogenase accessory factor
MYNDYVVIQGGGDLASGVAHKLFRSGLQVVILEMAQPLCVRRTVSFAQAVLDKETEIEGIKAVLAETPHDIQKILSHKHIPVWVSDLQEAIDFLKPSTVINATLAKKNNGMKKGLAPLTIALGPGFVAGKDVDIVVETKRGHYLGTLIYDGPATPNTGIPGKVKGYGVERVLRAPCDGIISHVHDIGTLVKQDDIICYVEDIPVKAPFDGIVRGLIMNHRHVPKDIKNGEVDPRGDKNNCTTLSDKARAIGGAVLEAILHHRSQAGTT